MIKLQTSLTEIKGIGPRFAVRLKNLGLVTVRDLLWHFPFRYDDFSLIKKISELQINEQATIQAEVLNIKMQRTWKRKMFIVQALVSDGSGSMNIIWFNQVFIYKTLRKGTWANFAGKVTSKDGKIYLSSPIYEVIKTQINADTNSDKRRLDTDVDLDERGLSIGVNQSRGQRESELRDTGRLVPVYPETRGVTSKYLRFMTKPILDDLEKLAEPLPQAILIKNKLPEINKALYDIHFPEEPDDAKDARKRFAFEDLFMLQINNLKQRLKLNKEKSFNFVADLGYLKSLISELPFPLTQSQKKTLWEIIQDFGKPRPMNRLLQGDVGSGKTIVAGLAALLIASEEKQSAFMAPTEVLARQHYGTFKKFFPEFTGGIGLITSAGEKIFYGDGLESEVKKNKFTKDVEEGKIKIIIGTHALIQKNISFKDLAFIIIDEQHRFGVKQRAELVGRNFAYMPHFLSMSATPIPRTLSLTLFGDLDLSIIDELPKGRKEILTKIVAPENRDKAYAFIRGQVKRGRQAFVICPRIDPAEVNGNPFVLDVRAVKEEYEKLSKKVFPDLRVAMLHGKLKSKEKVDIMKNFRDGKTDILVSTSVIEVGVDVPNATIMVIEGSDRFGLAQLYQFRGRVGRGEHQSFCFLFTDSSSKSTYRRLRSLIDAKSGFELAEKDLAIRGPGEILGESQTGIPDLAMKAIQNPDLIKSARVAAEEIVETDPELDKHPALKKRMEAFEREVHLE